jgi:selenocysteine-specific elongation factor
MAIIGTAGHIDHGKTALIKALTGIDTDRLKEERERGISIDLGFAYFDLEGDERAGVVDVPGHERFIRNMLAGAHGMDLVLLVVAADDGVMPQTEEHLDILHLLGVSRGIVVISKIDLVDAARRAQVREEVEILLAGTSLEGAPFCEVSSVTGEGLAELRRTIMQMLEGYRRADPGGCFRMPIDRAFTMRGHGLVVTGTATAGTLRADDSVRILPGGELARVRGIEVHGRRANQIHHGQRVALNLGGIEAERVGRGTIVCSPELSRATARFDALVELRPAARRQLANHSVVRVYLGTAEAMGKIVWLDGRSHLAPKESAYAQLVLREPVAAFGNDQFILRDQTARTTIGGGIVLHPFADKPRRGEPRAAQLDRICRAGTAEERLAALLDLDAQFATSAADLAAASNLTTSSVHDLLSSNPQVRPLPDAETAEAYTTARKWERLRELVGRALEEFHREFPRQPGLEMESLRSRLAPDLSPKVFRALIAQLEEEGLLVRRDSLLHLPSHSSELGSDERRLADEVVKRLDAAALTPPSVNDLLRDLEGNGAPVRDVLDQLEREGRIARVSPDLYYSAAALERARQLIRDYLATHAEITAASFRDLIGASRKYSIALLTYFDRTGFTLRVGDVRKLRR